MVQKIRYQQNSNNPKITPEDKFGKIKKKSPTAKIKKHESRS